MNEELIDVLSPDGTPTGVAKPKSALHRDGDWHLAVHVWIVTTDGQLLLQRRARVKDNHPDLWDVSCAGHVDAGETAIDAALRETAEEIGIDLSADELIPFATLRDQFVLHDGAYLDNEILEVFIVRRDIDPPALALQTSEVDEVKLVTVEEFRRLLAEDRTSFVPHYEEYEMILRELEFTNPQI